MTPITLFKNLADDARLRCMLLLKDQGELCVCELMQALEQSQPKVSRNLALLRSSSLLSSRKCGQWVYYSLHPELPSWVLDVLERTLTGSPNVIAHNIHNLALMNSRPHAATTVC